MADGYTTVSAVLTKPPILGGISVQIYVNDKLVKEGVLRNWQDAVGALVPQGSKVKVVLRRFVRQQVVEGIAKSIREGGKKKVVSGFRWQVEVCCLSE